jgi:hypothetical protein
MSTRVRRRQTDSEASSELPHGASSPDRTSEAKRAPTAKATATATLPGDYQYRDPLHLGIGDFE